MALTVLLPVLALIALNRVNQAVPPALDPDSRAFAGSGWHILGENPPEFPRWRPDFRDSADSWQRVAERNGARVGVFLAYYRGQDRKLVTSTNTLVNSDDKVWVATPVDQRLITVGGSQWPIAVARIQVRGQNKDHGLVAWHCYWVAGHLVIDPTRARLHSAWGRLLGQGDDGAAIVLYAPADGPGGGEAALEAFLRSAGEELLHLLERTRSQR